MIKESAIYMEQYLNHQLSGEIMHDGLLYKASVILQDWLERISSVNVPFEVKFDYENRAIKVII